MADIYLGVTLMVLLGMASFHLTRRLAARWTQRRLDLLALLTVLLLCAYIRWCWDHVRLASYLPYSNLIIVGNWFLPMLGILAGLVWCRIHDASPRRWIAVGLLLGSGVYATVSPVLGDAPECRSRWEGRHCLQTTGQTCAPAAAATLLRLHGIEATEQEMADLCLTRRGTTWKGLYRGLKVKTAGTVWDVEVFSINPASADVEETGPAILCAVLEPESELADEYQKEWGLIPGVPHSVVYLHRTHRGELMMFDPVAGREQWTDDDLDELGRGEGLRLVRRSSEDVPSPLREMALSALGVR